MRMEGFLLIDKPAGMTSHDVVDAVRRATGERRVGHAGTLDPFATGLLLVGVGRPATRELGAFVGLPKRYEATFVFGASSDTDDRTGSVTRVGEPPLAATVLETLPSFVGHVDQVPPRYSAVKVKGRKLYEAARKGEEIEAKPRAVAIHRLEALGTPEVRPDGLVELPVVIDCSSGTYVRALARDIGAMLGTGGYVESLRRTQIGPFDLSESIPLAGLNPEAARHQLVPIQDLLARLPALQGTVPSASLKG